MIRRRHQETRRIAQGATLLLLVLTACQGGPAATPPTEEPPVALTPDVTRSTPGVFLTPPPDKGPQRVRPPWNGTRKTPAVAQTLAYPTTWQGDLTVRDLALIGQTLYTVDRTLRAVPLEGGRWAEVPLSGAQGLTRMASDGQRLFAGTDRGEVMGLDPAGRTATTLATVPSAVTGLQVGQNVLWVGTERDGVYRVPVSGGGAQALTSGDAGGRRIADLALGTQVVYTLGDRIWAWPMDRTPARAVPGTDGATALTAQRGVMYAGTVDGWVLRSRDQGVSSQALGQMVDTPIESLGTDSAWLYSSSGNTTYMLDLKRYNYSLCHPGFAAPVTNLTVKDGETVLVGTRGKGMTSMPR